MKSKPADRVLEAGCTIASPNIKEPHITFIDRLRHDIQQRLEQLLAEADTLRLALAALAGAEQPAPASTVRRTARRGPTQPRRSASKDPSPHARSDAGATRVSVLGALAEGSAMTAGEIAAATGLGRATVSTALTTLARRGEVLKAERGYRRPRATTDTGEAQTPPMPQDPPEQ